jgi:hypothetical protein
MLRMRREELRPGWHPDPTGRHRYREWNGRSWTEHVSDFGKASVDPLEVGSRPRKAKRRRLAFRPPSIKGTPASTTGNRTDEWRHFWGESARSTR